MAEKGKLTDKQISEAIELYKMGYSPYRLADIFNVTPTAIRYHLERSGVKIRSRSEAKRRKDMPPLDVLKHEYEHDKMSAYALGKKYDIPPTTIYAHLKEAGANMRNYRSAKKLEAKRREKDLLVEG